MNEANLKIAIQKLLEKYITGFVLMFMLFAVQIALGPQLIVYIGNLTTLSSNSGIMTAMSVLFWILVGVGDLLLFVKILLPKMGSRS